MQCLVAQTLLQRQREEEDAAQREEEPKEAKEKEKRKANIEEKMLEINCRVRDCTATPAQFAAWRRWMGFERNSSSTCSVKRRKRKKRQGRLRSQAPSAP